MLGEYVEQRLDAWIQALLLPFVSRFGFIVVIVLLVSRL